MVRSLLLLAAVIVPITSYSQKTRIIEVVSTRDADISMAVRFNDAGDPMDSIYYMMGQNAKYSSIIDIVTVAMGSKSEIKELLQKCLQAVEQEPDGTIIDQNGVHLYVVHLMGTKYVWIREQDDGSGYVELNRSQLSKLLSKL